MLTKFVFTKSCLFLKAHGAVILLTETGYLMLVKSFTDDLAWQVQRQLVKTYFRLKQESTPPNDAIPAQSQGERLEATDLYDAIYKIIVLDGQCHDLLPTHDYILIKRTSETKRDLSRQGFFADDNSTLHALAFFYGLYCQSRRSAIMNPTINTIFQFGGKPIRLFTDERGTLWCCAKDVWEALGYTDICEMGRFLQKHCEADGRAKYPHVNHLNRKVSLTFINEHNCCRLLSMSRSPAACRFSQWLSEEVCPQLRPMETGEDEPSGFTRPQIVNAFCSQRWLIDGFDLDGSLTPPVKQSILFKTVNQSRFTHRQLATVLARIAERKARYPVRPLALVCDEKGAALSPFTLRSRFDRAREKAGVAKSAFQFRDLRAKAATEKEQPAGMEATEKQLGHASETMTKRYVRNRIGPLVKPTK